MEKLGLVENHKPVLFPSFLFTAEVGCMFMFAHVNPPTGPLVIDTVSIDHK